MTKWDKALFLTELLSLDRGAPSQTPVWSARGSYLCYLDF